MKPKILLFEPGVKITKYPPLGILVLGGFMREQGYPIALKDYSGKEITEEDIELTIRKQNPRYIGIRVLTGPHIPRALKISKVAKKLGKKVIWGGPHPTILPEKTLEHRFVDAVVVGEGEYALLDLIKYFEGAKIKPLGSGIKENNQLKFFPPQTKCVDINLMPFPAWDLLKNINEYFLKKENNVFPIVASRGCPFKCGFCHNASENVKKFLGKYRVLSPKRVLDEYEFVQGLIKNKIGMIDADSDYHLVSKKYTQEWCEELKKRAPHLKWSTCARYATIDMEMVDMLGKSNCISINLGVESGSKRLQKFNQKIIDLQKAIKIASELKKRKIFVINTYIFGHPTESLNELKQTIKYIRKIPASLNLIQIYRPIPGTPYFQLALNEKKVIPFKKLEEWNTFGTMKKDINLSRVPSAKLFFYFYTINFLEQIKAFYETQKFNIRNGFSEDFFDSFINNRFMKKLKELLESYRI